MLVAEDNAVNQKVTLHMLEKLGLAADLATDGRQAVAAAAARDYDVILMDCQMPDMDGFAATAAIREAEESGGKRPARIVAMPANAMPGDREHCLAAGMDDYLPKPLRIEDLRALLTPAQDTPALDRERLLAQAGGDEGAARELLTLYLETTRPLLEQLAAAVETEDGRAARLAHEIKGASGYIRAEAMTDLARTVEKAVKDGEWETARSASEELEAAFIRLLAESGDQ